MKQIFHRFYLNLNQKIFTQKKLHHPRIYRFFRNKENKNWFFIDSSKLIRVKYVSATCVNNSGIIITLRLQFLSHSTLHEQETNSRKTTTKCLFEKLFLIKFVYAYGNLIVDRLIPVVCSIQQYFNICIMITKQFRIVVGGGLVGGEGR